MLFNTIPMTCVPSWGPVWKMGANPCLSHAITTTLLPEQYLPIQLLRRFLIQEWYFLQVYSDVVYSISEKVPNPFCNLWGFSMLRAYWCRIKTPAEFLLLVWSWWAVHRISVEWSLSGWRSNWWSSSSHLPGRPLIRLRRRYQGISLSLSYSRMVCCSVYGETLSLNVVTKMQLCA